MKNHYSVVIVGGGQAGLSISYLLKEKGIDHIIFEKDRIAESWRTKRWDSFCLVTPNFQCRLPGYTYNGPDPDGFMLKDDVVKFVEDYAKMFNPPVHEGVKVLEVTKDGETFHSTTTLGNFTSDQVVIAAGNFQYAVFPEISKQFPKDILQLHSSEYKNPDSLPDKDILVVGTGQSGCQIAEDLHLAGKNVHLCVGKAPRSARNYRGKDVVAWLEEMKYYDINIYDHPDGMAARTKTNHYLTGRDGGREIDLRAFAKEGMQLYGKFTSIENGKLHFDSNLKENLDAADASCERIKQKIDAYIETNNIIAPTEAPYQAPWEPTESITELDVEKSNIGTVIWSIGYGFDFSSWVKLPVFDEKGYPKYERGITDVEGLFFLGLAWMYTWGSGRFCGISPDAEFLAEKMEELLKVKS